MRILPLLLALAWLALGHGAQATTLEVTVVHGTASCGSPGLTTGPTAPVSGELDADVGGTTPVAQLGLGCLS